MNFKLIGAAAVSLMLLATPAMAMHHGYRHHHHSYSSLYGAYNFYRGHDFAPRDDYRNDFDRRNTFN